MVTRTAARLGNMAVRAASTAISVASIAVDLWRGLNAGTVKWDPIPSDKCMGCWRTTDRLYPTDLFPACEACLQWIDADIIDEDPPRPDVEWQPHGERPWSMTVAGGVVEGVPWGVRAWSAPGGWSWQTTVLGEHAQGRTILGVDEAKRRAEEALAVMLESQR